MQITIAPGDGVGPETMEVVLDALRLAGARLEPETVELGHAEDAPGAGWRASLARTGVLLKGPTADPRNAMALRRAAGVYAEKRVYRMLPGVPTPLGVGALNLTFVRERLDEGLRADEHRVEGGVGRYSRTVSTHSAERVHRYAFEMAARKGAPRVTCGHLGHELAGVDGPFVDAFRAVAREYPGLRADDLTVRDLALGLVAAPESFGVVVLPDMPGDILPDLAAGLIGGLAYAPCALVGETATVFEPVHGPLPERAGRDVANPTALLLAATMLLRHVGQLDAAERVERALGRTLHALHHDPLVRANVSGFRTSVFRHLLLAELSREARAGRSASAAPRRPGRTTDWSDQVLASQLEGLA